ncbi:MogA/MoaB family molybdenum cofactor biosynthesis protein [Clostridium sp. MT-14]|jgi:molybdenum cofactor synthesis domain-containing protein|uniref:MogA/MoaB family molybdenum cofactor biosynthesis protein n=1 Tax=Clostridium aromativorans TaxID=2836848 RepID=A0ABS8N5S2_9CLOT|nr:MULTISPECIES: MogA/MoaB family molybdenum cofactor biosynthesis protein [Clostridium]KAA8663788.1 MogA/MoaB family molybdenum cofactor biosynthesis protein [Clostridium sp. HV4-5-A1G]MCC9295153.1 MogA/MoaB family molybdenum cofactor biosynthesis protein [Clostridium aromativorans]CAB1248142.1 Molybdopterin adenylyltransferase [Clostridiaceae bacterium BL-3]
MIETAVITISDKGSQGKRIDKTGPEIKNILDKSKYNIVYYKIIPDEIEDIESELCYVCDELKVNLVLTNGGTGFSPRDVTPEATLKVIEKNVPGVAEAMRMKSMEITPKAMLSRSVCGIRKSTLIVNLPGSPKGAAENLQFILPALPHGIDILMGWDSECGERK